MRINTANRRVVAAAVVAAGLVLSACAATPDRGSDAVEPDGDASGTCGTVPDVGANDPDGLLEQFSAEVASAYNGHPLQVRESAWSDWAPDHEGPYRAALITNPPSNPFQVSLYEALRETLAENDVELIAEYAPASYTDVPQQLQQFEQAVSLDPDIIYFMPLAPGPAVEAVAAAADAGIPVVGVHVPIDSEYAVSVTQNSVLQAIEAGARVFETIGGEGTVLQVRGIPGIATDVDASAGYEAALELCPDITVAGEVTGNFEPGTAQAETLRYLAANPVPVDAVIQSGTMGVGVLQAFLESGRDPVPIADLGASQGFVSWALQNPDYPYVGSGTPSARMGQVIAEVGIRMLHGEGPKVNQLVTRSLIVTRDNLAELGDESWETTDTTDFIGDPEQYFPEGTLDEFFAQPGAGG